MCDEITIDDLRANFDIITDRDDNGKTIYYFKCDKEDKEIFDKIKSKFELSVYPHQWWGNIENPSVVVLALNPGYSAGADELDSIVFGDLIEKNYKLEEVNGHFYGQFLFGESKNKDNIPFKYSSISKWWRNVFDGIFDGDLFNSYDKDEIESLNKNVGFFNLIGYQSKKTKDVTCPSKEIIVKYINELASKNKNIFFIFVWGKSSWLNSELKITNNFIEINKNNENKKISSQNKMLSVKIPADEDKKLFKNILIGNEVDENKLKVFMKKYNIEYNV